ncbi:DUF3341 domain-containing protein [Bacteroidales bacterium AH-315-N07]|nr:DUF3341 domain-containing protein [Bacteroidales bacterium AH-315-N07]
MEKSKFLLGLFDDEEILLKAIRAFRKEEIKIYDVYTPFPVHGMEDALGIKYTRIPIAAFCIGATFCILAFCTMWFISTVDFPINFGGKPTASFPSFIPPTFEATILSTGIGMAVILFTSCWLAPSTEKHPIDLRITDDRFVMAFMVDESFDESRISEFLNTNGAVEITKVETEMIKSLKSVQ